MEINSLNAKDAYTAYRKLKSLAYYDSTNLKMKLRIAEFEEDFLTSDSYNKNVNDEAIENKFSDIIEVAKDPLTNYQKLKEWLEEMKLIIIPKSFKKDDYEIEGYITNILPREKLTVEKLNCLCDAPVELYILSILWIMTVGRKIDVGLGVSDQYKKVCYAHRLVHRGYNQKDSWAEHKNAEDRDEDVDGLLLFEPYYQGYSDWRDLAIAEAVNLLNDKKNASIVSFDIRRFFYSARMSVEELIDSKSVFNDLEENLTKILQRIHLRYSILVKEYLPEEFKDLHIDTINENNHENLRLPLPVGMPSSGILANWYLHKWDKKVIGKLHPQYYGRYVDDILLVFADRRDDLTNGEDKRNYLENFIRNVFEASNLLKRKNEGNEINYVLTIHDEKNKEEVENDSLILQKSKIILQHFDYRESKAAIIKFKKKIDERRSEFRFLPEEEKTQDAFEDSAYELQYSDSVNKLRGMKKLSVDKFGASIYLTRKLMLVQSSDYSYNSEDELKETAKQILVFFKGQRNIEMMSLWEKVATYFIITNQKWALKEFINQTMRDIEQLQISDQPHSILDDDKLLSGIDVNIQLRKNLQELLQLSVALPVAVNPSFIDGLLDKPITDSNTADKE